MKSVPFGNFRRIILFAHSFDPRSQLVYGWQQYILVRLPFRRIDRSRLFTSENSPPLSTVIVWNTRGNSAPNLRSIRFKARTVLIAVLSRIFSIISFRDRRSVSTNRAHEPSLPEYTVSISQCPKVILWLITSGRFSMLSPRGARFVVLTL